MTLDKLINEYKTLPVICSKINYLDKLSIKANNKAVSRMYQIVDLIKEKYGQKGTEEFQKLLDINQFDTNLWVAAQLLEKLNPDKRNETKALNIIKKRASAGDAHSFGFEIWLKNWTHAKKS